MSPSAVPCHLVVVVDKDAAVREALAFVLELEGYGVLTFETAEALLAHPLPGDGVCLVIEERASDMPGLDALRRLRERGSAHPAILMTGKPRFALIEEAEAAGAVVVEKPLVGESLQAAIRAAFKPPE